MKPQEAGAWRKSWRRALRGIPTGRRTGYRPETVPEQPAQPPVTHDLTGTDYAFKPRDSGQRGSIAAWDDLHPRPGDYLILRNGAGTTRYQVTSTDDCWGVDPPTMWMAQLLFAPRPAPDQQTATVGEEDR